MRFKVGGEPFELTAEQVVARLDSRRPGSIRLHWVEVNGQRWPVKPALAIVLGGTKGFNSRYARDVFRRLGFAVSTIDDDSASEPRRPEFDVEALRALDSVTALVQFEWREAGPILLDDNDVPRFPDLPSTPGIYRFSLRPCEKRPRPTLYVGESHDLAQRGRNFGTPRPMAGTTRRAGASTRSS